MKQATKATPLEIRIHQSKRQLEMARHASKDARKGVIHRAADFFTKVHKF